MISTWLLIAPMILTNPSVQTSTAAPAQRVIVVSGEGRAPARMRGPQARLMARRAAEVVALRNLAHELNLPTPATLTRFRFISAAHRSDGSVVVVLEWREALPSASRL